MAFLERGKVDAPVAGPAGLSAMPGDEAALWQAFARADDASAFCEGWLALQCTQVAGARAALLLVRDADGVFAPAAIWPSRQRDVSHLAPAAEAALRERRPHLVPPAQSGAGTLAHLACPVLVEQQPVAVVVIEAVLRGDAQLSGALRQMQWGTGWLEALFRRKQSREDASSLARTGFALDMVAVAAEHHDIKALARALTTALAARLRCRSVAVGLVARGQTRLLALSHAAAFERTSQPVVALENAMDESVDQAASIAEPPLPATGRRISLAHRDYLAICRTGAVISTPLFSRGHVIGAITFEHDAIDGFDAGSLAMIESVGVLMGPLFDLRRDNDRLVSGKLVSLAGKGVTAVVGPRRPAVKVLAALSVVAVVALAVASGPFRVSARATIEGEVQRAAVAPFEGFVATAPARAGDVVREGQVLATLDDRDLQLEAARWRSERDQQRLRYEEALGKRERATAQITEALIRQAQAQLDLVEARIARARIEAPFAGVIVSGDLSQQLGSPVERGKLLFEIAPLASYRVILQVDERDIVHVARGQTGTMLIKGLARDPAPIEIGTVTPVASAANGRNTFRVEARLTGSPAALRPGMEGVAKVEITSRSLLWIWTRALTDWLRITWWSWTP
jgi:multidrug efflux pump subunit AcrA (membrane-fusion protein)